MGCAQGKPSSKGKLIQMISRSHKSQSFNSSLNSSFYINTLLNFDISNDAITAKEVNRRKTTTDVSFIRACLKNTTLFSTLSEDDLIKVSDSMKLLQVNQGDNIIEQDKPGNTFFILHQGNVEIIIDNKRIKLLKPGDSFGELALIQNTLRTSTVVAVNEVQLWSITRNDFHSLLTSITTSNFNENKEFVSSIPVFSDLSGGQMDDLINSIVQMHFSPNSRILGLNEKGSSLFIIKEGTVSCIIRGVEQVRLNRGDYFGEISILNNTTRKSAVIALNNVICLMVSKQVLNNVFQGKFKKILYNNIILEQLKRHKLLGIISEAQLKVMAGEFTICSFRDEPVIERGIDLGSAIWIMLKGEIRKGGELVDVYTFFGVEQVISGGSLEIDDHVTCDGECEIGKLETKYFRELFGDDFGLIEELNEVSSLISKINYISDSNPEVINKIARSKEYLQLNKGEVAIDQDQEVPGLILLKTGKVRIGKEEFGHGFAFGLHEVFTGNNSKARVECIEDCVFWLFHKEVISKNLDPKYFESIKSHIYLKTHDFELSDLKILETLSRSKFTFKYICETPVVTQVQATAISRCYFTQPRKKYVIQELEAVKNIDHPLIVQHIKFLKDDLGLYTFQEHVEGTPLSEGIQIIHQNFEYFIKFYFSCLVEIVSYLSDKKIILRNLSTDSFLIDQEGYPRLADLTTSVISEDRCCTVLSSPCYTPPEVIAGKGYEISSMYWTLGIILYELISGEVPFGQTNEDPYLIYEKILKKRLIYSEVFDNFKESKRLIEQLLCKTPKFRIPGGPSKLKLQSYFTVVKWDQIKLKKLQPPVPPPPFLKHPSSAPPSQFLPDIKDDYPEDWSLF